MSGLAEGWNGSVLQCHSFQKMSATPSDVQISSVQNIPLNPDWFMTESLRNPYIGLLQAPYKLVV